MDLVGLEVDNADYADYEIPKTNKQKKDWCGHGSVNCRVALSRHTKVNSQPFNKRSQEFQMLSKINK